MGLYQLARYNRRSMQHLRIIKWWILLIIFSSQLTACASARIYKSIPQKRNDQPEDLQVISFSTNTPSPSYTLTSSPAPIKKTPTRIAHKPSVPTSTSTLSLQICSPLAGFPLHDLPRIISDPYRPPPPRSDERHEGVDFVYSLLVTGKNSILGVPILSVLPGRVAAAITNSFPYGNFVIIETPFNDLSPEIVSQINITPDKSLYLLYAHMQEPPMVRLEQEIIGCQPVGRVGATGNTLAPHLHLETRIGQPRGTFPVMSAFLFGTTPEERNEYKRWRTSGEFVHFNPMLLLDLWSIPTSTPLP
jgi:murein DD-endopeptidase MepM/ murein hydrolase activator NlpD